MGLKGDSGCYDCIRMLLGSWSCLWADYSWFDIGSVNILVPRNLFRPKCIIHGPSNAFFKSVTETESVRVIQGVMIKLGCCWVQVPVSGLITPGFDLGPVNILVPRNLFRPKCIIH